MGPFSLVQCLLDAVYDSGIMSDEKCTEEIRVRIQPSLLKRAGAMARRMAIGPSTLTRIALTEYLDRRETQTKEREI